MPLVPLGTQYTATATDLIECRFRCASCGAEAKASVLTTSVGVASGAPLGIGGSTHAAEAGERAVAGLSAEALALSELALCPSCKTRDPGAVRRAALHIAPLGLFLGALIGAPLSIFGSLVRVSPWLVAPPIAIVIAALYTLRVVRHRFAQVDRMVELEAGGGNAETARSAE